MRIKSPQYYTILLLTITFSIVHFSCSEKKKYEDSLSPEESIETFDLLNGFKTEVFASEPHVTDPVELTFD